MPVRLKFFFEGGGDTTVTVWNDQQIQSFTIPLSRQVWSMQFDPENWILRSATPAEVAGSDEGIPAITRLEQNYPNPFNPLTRLRYTIARRGNVLLDVWNMLGERVATLVQGVQAAGTYEATFEGGHLPAGVYLARLSAVGRVEVTKMLLVK